MGIDINRGLGLWEWGKVGYGRAQTRSGGGTYVKALEIIDQKPPHLPI